MQTGGDCIEAAGLLRGVFLDYRVIGIVRNELNFYSVTDTLSGSVGHGDSDAIDASDLYD